MTRKEQVEGLISEKLAGTELFLVELRVSPAGKIEVFIDGMKGVSIKDCVGVSRHIESSLDREEEDFELNVSSPGAEEPFRVKQQYLKNIGRRVSVSTIDGKVIEGVLVEYNDSSIAIESTGKKKKENGKGNVLVSEKISLGMDQVKQTKIIISFK
jgi:ribosome maturation factor RimP